MGKQIPLELHINVTDPVFYCFSFFSECLEEGYTKRNFFFFKLESEQGDNTEFSVKCDFLLESFILLVS